MLLNTLGQQRILFVTSNQHYYGSTKLSTANHFEEVIVPYDFFTKAGFQVDIVSPKGGAIPVGYINTSDSLQKNTCTMVGLWTNWNTPGSLLK